MKIIRMNKLHGGKTLAFSDVETDDWIILKGFRIVDGSKWKFITSPDEKGKDGKYYETVILPKEMKDKIKKLALEEYQKQD